jgi:hypothetical protein
MEKQRIRTPEGKQETLFVLLAVIIGFLVCAAVIALRHRGDTGQVLTDTQISAFNDFNTMEQGTYNDLLIAVEEIRYFRDANRQWPAIADLADSFVPPFIRDSAWEARGELDWSFEALESIGQYTGLPAESQISGSFLLVLHGDDDGEPPEIWYSKREVSEIPKVLDDDALLFSGWLEVVPYRGEDELQRIKG